MDLESSGEDVEMLTDLGRQRLSENFFMREMLYSEVGNAFGIPNVPEQPDLAVEVGSHVANELLEPLKRAFGHVSIRSAYRSPRLNAFCHQRYKLGDLACWCTDNTANAARHIWDRRDVEGKMGGTITVFVPAYLEHYGATGDYRPLAWWIRDNISGYAELFFFRKLCAFNIRWYEGSSDRPIWFVDPPTRRLLTDATRENFNGSHASFYPQLMHYKP